jgi:hypothetical protein
MRCTQASTSRPRGLSTRQTRITELPAAGTQAGRESSAYVVAEFIELFKGPPESKATGSCAGVDERVVALEMPLPQGRPVHIHHLVIVFKHRVYPAG